MKRPMMTQTTRAFGAALALLLLVGCSASPPAPTSPTATPAATAALTNIPPTSTPQPTSSPSPDWKIVTDDRIGIRYAIPCFWQADVPAPEQDPSGIGSYPVRNFTDEYVQSFGNKRADLIWENGAKKVDVLIFEASTWNLEPGSSLEDFAQAALGSDPDTSSVESTTPVRANGQDGLLVAQRSAISGDLGHVWLFSLSPDRVLGISPAPLEAYDDPDIEGIVNSLALNPETEVAVPSYAPEAPPEGIDGGCLTGTP